MTNDEKLVAYNDINVALASVSAYLSARRKALETEFGFKETRESQLGDIVDKAREGIVDLIVDHLEEVVVRHEE